MYVHTAHTCQLSMYYEQNGTTYNILVGAKDVHRLSVMMYVFVPFAT